MKSFSSIAILCCSVVYLAQSQQDYSDPMLNIPKSFELNVLKEVYDQKSQKLVAENN